MHNPVACPNASAVRIAQSLSCSVIATARIDNNGAAKAVGTFDLAGSLQT
jgi:hypothetical protein